MIPNFKLATTASIPQTVMMAITTVAVLVSSIQLVLGHGAVEPALGELHSPQGYTRELRGLRYLR